MSADRITELYETPTAVGSSRFAPEGHDIVFEHVDFAYDEKEVLHDVSFTAKEGEVTALVGLPVPARAPAQGSPPDCGTSRKAGSSGRRGYLNSRPGSTPHRLLYGLQDVVLFDDTVMENIRLGKRGATDAEVIAAARAANCEEFVSRLPQGYDTPIGENGARLSGGERQRISLPVLS